MKYYLYLLTNYKNTVLYLGVTNDLKRRVKEHKDGTNKGFSKKYKCNKGVINAIWFNSLVYNELNPDFFNISLAF